MHYVDPIIKKLYRVPQPEGRESFLRLDQNENPDGVPRWLFDEAMKKITPEFLSVYPEETKLTKKYAELLGLQLENVTLTDGSVVGMGYVIKVFGEPGKKLLCVTPSFGMYKVYAEMSGMEAISLKYESDYTFNSPNIINAIDSDIGIVALVNPNMPIGNVYTQNEIENIIKRARENNALVIIDEAYYYFYDESSIDFIKKYDNVVILRTFSKMLSIPSLRLGVLISSPENIRYLNNFKPHYTVNSIALSFGEAIVDNYDRLLKELKEKFIKGRDYFFNELEKMGYSYIPSHGCFACVRPKHKSPEKLTEDLRQNNVLILCGKGDTEGFLRVTIWDEKYMKQFMEILKKLDTE